MYFNIVASGSKGNATLIANKNDLLLIDMGVSLTCLKHGLENINKTLDDIDGCLITHNHSDHISGVRYLKNTKTYALKNTLSGSYNVIEPYVSFQIKSFKITPVLTSHDAINPCGFVIEDGDEKLVYITDTGYISDKTIEYAFNPTYLIIESNHDLSMLMNSNRSAELKRRIRSDVGHLSNEDSAFYCLDIISKNTKQIVLAHLSQECNTPFLAKTAYERVFDYAHKDISKYKIKIARQDENLIGGRYEN